MKMTQAELHEMERRPYTLLWNKLVETECIRKATPSESADGEEATYRRPLFTERKRIADALLPVVDELVLEAAAAATVIRREQIKRLVDDVGPSGNMREDHEDEARSDLVDALYALLNPADLPAGQYVIVAQTTEGPVAGSIGPYGSRDAAERALPKLSVLNGGMLTVVPIASAP